MGLLHDIQEAVVQEGNALGPILLKLRLLAARLGSKPLEDWVTHESEGYPRDSPVPSYRQVGVSYKGMFMFPGGRYIQNAQIPGSLVASIAGEQWAKHEIRDGIAVVDDLVRRSVEGGGDLGIDAS